MKNFKKILALLLALMCMFLCACNTSTSQDQDNPPSTSDTPTSDTLTIDTSTSDTTIEIESTTEETTVAPTPPENPDGSTSYLPREISEQISKEIENDPQLLQESSSMATIALQDAITLSNCQLLSITIPIYRVTATDAEGNFIHTINVITNNLPGLITKPLRSYAIKINAEEYGLQANSVVRKLITVDVSDYNIVLSAKESMSFGNRGDTAILAKITKAQNPVRELLSNEYPQATGNYVYVGTTSVAFNNATYPFNFKLKYAEPIEFKTISNDTEYQALVKTLKEKYKGKTVSILGDSISTFNNISNNPSYNKTLSKNNAYYKDQLISSDVTYWGRLIKDLEMELCVNNSSGGARVFGSAGSGNYYDAGVLRGVELDHDNGTPNDPTDDKKPDVIIVYLGTNDATNIPYGELNSILESADPANYNSLIKTWFDKVLAKTANATAITPGVSYTTVEEAYALTFYKMKQAYPDAEIICLNLLTNGATAQNKVMVFNRIISALSSYFDLTLADIYKYSGFSLETRSAYTVDTTGVHPNAAGHFAMTKGILKSLAESK